MKYLCVSSNVEGHNDVRTNKNKVEYYHATRIMVLVPKRQWYSNTKIVRSSDMFVGNGLSSRGNVRLGDGFVVANCKYWMVRTE